MPDRALRRRRWCYRREPQEIGLNASNARQGIKTFVGLARFCGRHKSPNASNARQGIKTNIVAYDVLLLMTIGPNASNARQGIKTLTNLTVRSRTAICLNASNARQGIKTAAILFAICPRPFFV